METDEAQKCILLLASVQRDVYYGFRQMVYQRMPEKQIMDIFGKIVNNVTFFSFI